MEKTSIRYGGLAAVFVFGIGLLAVGKIWAGIAVLVFGALVMALALTPGVGGKALLVAMGAVLLGGVLGFHAVQNEITGKAVYHHPRGTRVDPSEPVTRESSPQKFREATNHLWAGSLASLFVAAVGFGLYRKLDD